LIHIVSLGSTSATVKVIFTFARSIKVVSHAAIPHCTVIIDITLDRVVVDTRPTLVQDIIANVAILHVPCSAVVHVALMAAFELIIIASVAAMHVRCTAVVHVSLMASFVTRHYFHHFIC
jgi:hypothetical protein